MGISIARKCRDQNIRVVKINNSDLFWININDLERKLCCTNIRGLIMLQING